MIDYADKIRKHCSEHLDPDETVAAGTLAQPAGAVGRQMGFGVAGIVGSAVASKAAKKREAEFGDVDGAGMAASLPKKPLVLGVTPKRLLAFTQGGMSGRPKDLVGSFPLRDVHTIELDKRKMAYRMVVRFGDGSAVDFDVIRTLKPTGFVEAFERLKG